MVQSLRQGLITFENLMHIAIAGATGILGRWLVPLLVKQGCQVRALTPSPAKARQFFAAEVEVAACDLLDPQIEGRLAALLAGCESVAHIATSLPRDLSAPGAFDRNNRLRAEGAERLLRASASAGVARYVQQSIVFGYPARGDQWIGEDVALEQGDGVVVNMESMVRDSPLQWCILRGGRFVGKHTYQEQTVERLRQGLEVVPCDGSNFISLIHVADMATACAAALERAPAGTTFNIVAEPVRNGEYLDQLAVRAGAPAPRRDPAAKCPKSQRCSNAAATAMLAWTPMHSIYANDV
jgi:nucleoside-diphosphate-sugar epimerase